MSWWNFRYASSSSEPKRTCCPSRPTYHALLLALYHGRACFLATRHPVSVSRVSSNRAQTVPLPIHLPHHKIQAAYNRRNVGDQAAAADGVGDAQVTEARRAGADAQGYGVFGRAADDVEAHLAARGFGFDVGLAGGQVLGRLDAV